MIWQKTNSFLLLCELENTLTREYKKACQVVKETHITCITPIGEKNGWKIREAGRSHGLCHALQIVRDKLKRAS